MRRGLVFVPLVVLCCGTAGEGAEISVFGRSAQSFQIARVDPVWLPTTAQVQGWVNDGINAAAEADEQKDVLVVPGVKQWIWGYPDCIPVGRGQGLRFVIAATPQFVATAAGWAAAWHKETWARIQVNQDEVVAEIARATFNCWRWGRLLFSVGIQGRPDPDDGRQPRIAMFYNESWRCSDSLRYSMVEELAQTRFPRGRWTALWAVSYVLKNTLECSALSDPDNIAVALVELEQRPTGPPEGAFDPGLPTPTVFVPGYARLAVGYSGNLRYVDLRLNTETGGGWQP